jgi:hypothetical protein
MSKISPDKIRKLTLQGRIIPIIEEKDGKFYLMGYKRKATSRKNDSFLLPEPEELPNYSK